MALPIVGTSVSFSDKRLGFYSAGTCFESWLQWYKKYVSKMCRCFVVPPEQNLNKRSRPLLKLTILYHRTLRCSDRHFSFVFGRSDLDVGCHEFLSRFPKTDCGIVT